MSRWTKGVRGRLLAIAALCFAFSAVIHAQPERAPARVHPVVSVVKTRLANASLPGQRTDGQKLCLVIEGGAMRGVVSAGMVTALERLGLRDLFDAVYGTSAGAINGAYFLANQAAYGTTIYYENLNNSRFISRWRLIGPGPLLSIDYALDEVMVDEKALDWRAVLRSTVPLKIVATSTERRRAEILEDFQSREALWESLRASARIPVIAGPPVQLEHGQYIDGVVYARIPVDLAAADLCTHVLVLQTRPLGAVPPTPGPLRRCLVRRYLRRFDPDLASRYGRGPSAYDVAIQRIHEASVSGEGPPYVLAVAPEPELVVSTLEKDGQLLINAAHEGCSALLRTFGSLQADARCFNAVVGSSSVASQKPSAD